VAGPPGRHDLLEFPGNHMTYLTEPAAVADGLRPLRERSAEPDSRPGIDLGGRVNDPASLVGACRHSRCPPLAHILLGRPGPDLPSLIGSCAIQRPVQASPPGG
jgi:hypothetical protein